jgi:hypothetical protein
VALLEDWVGTVVLACAVLLAVFVFRRRWLRRRGGTVEMSLRLRHWTFGLARYDHDRLLWFRTFSLSPRPARSYARADLRVVGRRRPHGPEAVAMVHDAVVLQCRDGEQPVELAVPDAAAMGLLAWLEATAPNHSFFG